MAADGSTLIDIRLIVSVAATLTLVSFAFLVSLLGTKEAVFRRAALWYGASLAGLIVAVLSVLVVFSLKFAGGAMAIIAGAHFGLLFAYLAIREAFGQPLPARRMIGLSVTICLGQAVVAVLAGHVSVLVATSSAVNGALGLLACSDLLRLAINNRRKLLFLPALSFALVGLCYLARLWLVFSGPNEVAVMAVTALIAFALGAASMAWGFALVLLRESWLNRQLMEAREEAETMVQQRTRFFSQMSHEIRTPLNGILGLTDLMSVHVKGEDGRGLLRNLRSSGELLLSIVNELLDFSKAEAGRIELESLPMDLAEVVRLVASQYRGLGQGKGVAVSFSVEPAPFPILRGDPTRMSQILHNLLSNALKFTSAGEVRVELYHAGDGVVGITVSDTGIGMTDAQLETLFQPYRQAASDTARRYGGTGLGMSIVKMLVDAMHGTVTVQSQPGRGTRFQLRLPLPLAQSALPRADAGEMKDDDWRRHAGRVRVLCADDDHINRLVLQAMLESIGITPIMAENGYDAVRLAAVEDFHAYLIDISMPGMDGVETLAVLKEGNARRGQDHPVAVAVTANVLSDDVGRYLAAGFDVHLPKPIGRGDLEAVLRRIVAERLSDHPVEA